jgi:hypothetical protein
MALVDGDGISGIRFDNGHLGQFGRQPPKLGVARSNRARVTIFSLAKQPNQFELHYGYPSNSCPGRMFGKRCMLACSSVRIFETGDITHPWA